MMKKEIMVMVSLLLGCALAVAQTGVGNGASSRQPQNQKITNGPVAEYVADSNATIYRMVGARRIGQNEH
jgi:hypothetical protein